jgi:hypothetical protein
MRTPSAPGLEKRRAAEFAAELQERARAWMPQWGLADSERDFGGALLEIAARFNSEVAERLDGAGEKMRRGFLDWLAVRGQAARPARMPVVFKLADTAQEGVLASAPVRLQADAGGTPVVFETEKEVRVVPGRLDVVVGVDADRDAFYLPPPGLSDLQPLKSLPTEWRVKSFAAAGSKKLQLDPELGLAVGMLIEANGAQYTIREASNGLVTIDRPLESELSSAIRISKVNTFSPFESTAYNSQEHSLYLGDSELLNVEAAATIEVVGASTLREGFTWQYWGKVDGKDEVGWQPLTLPDKKQTTSEGGIVLTKPRGAIEEYEIGGKKSRWIRAFVKTVEASRDPFTVDALSFRINAAACGENLPCPPNDPIVSPLAEAMANSTPLVLDNIFLPLGREPRQFDAFYLASAEAFSKKGAQVQICFELADPTFESLAVVRKGQSPNTVLAGVGKDRALHLFQFVPKDGTVSRYLGRDALRPPLPGDSGSAPKQTTPRQLNPKCRPVIESVGNDFFIRVASGGTIWTWHENATNAKLSGWSEFAALPDSPNQPARIDDIVPVDLPNRPQVVLSNCRLWVHDGTEWLEKETKDPNAVAVHLVALTPIWISMANNLEDLVPASMMVGVSEDNQLYRVDKDGLCTLLLLADLVHAGTAPSGSPCKVDAVRPATYQVGNIIAVVTANDARNKLVLYQGNPDSMVVPLHDSIDLPSGDQIISATVELSFVTGNPQFSVLCKTPAGATYAASWQPIDAPNIVKKILFVSTVSSLGGLNGAPVTLDAYIVAPGARGDLFVAPFSRGQRFVLAADAAEDGAVLSAIGDDFASDDVFSVLDRHGDRILPNVVTEVVKLAADAPEVLYAVTPTFGLVADNPKLLGYRVSDALKVHGGGIRDPFHLRLDANDSETVKDTFLLIEDGTGFVIRQVVGLTPNTFPTPPDAELDHALPAGASGNYWTPEESVARVAPIIRLDPATEGNWNASILDQARFYFLPPVDPVVQRGEAFAVTPFTNHPKVIALQVPWEQPPAANALYVIDAVLGEWQHSLADTSSNPELSWEYSNGTSWESLILQEEGTLHFKNTGRVKFTVPNNLAAVDWAGKTNHWIRARLIGGDYGREKVVVNTQNVPNGTQQTIDRSSEGIRAPTVVKLHISYGICSATPPAFVLAQDSGTIRDQSDANRTGGAIVEAFVPLAVMLGRLSQDVTSPDAPEDCPPECDCHTQPITPAASTPAIVSPPSTAPAPRVGGRELFIGLDAKPTEAPVNVLLLVEEHNHTNFAPLKIEALVANHFVPLVADDKTRALGESGLLEMSFAQPPALSELFGKTRTWLRLIPKPNPAGHWVPAIRGAYLNAVWASATETLTRELLDSSNGEPNLTVRLARPPVLHDTLELRVREPLGEEEREALRQVDKNIVLSDVDGLPGDWVLWKQVIDPGDEAAGERVYALDEAIGEIRFGDGLHGRIPPIGRDSIVAFRYSRTEPDPTGGDKVPGNMITARTALNLVSPVETVESVIAADQAAGGAPPESDERVLRFGFARLRHRNRAVTPADIEDLALQSSPDIVQACAFLRRGYMRLVVVMRGKNPIPNAGQIRELRDLLLAQAPVALSAPGALRIEGPRIRRLRIDLQLRIETLDHAGELTTFVKEQLINFFDTARGGIYNEGWALGAKPSEEDIALALIDAPYLESIGDVALLESNGETTVPGGLKTLKPTDLVMLADDPIRIQFETAEVMV